MKTVVTIYRPEETINIHDPLQFTINPNSGALFVLHESADKGRVRIHTTLPYYVEEEVEKT